MRGAIAVWVRSDWRRRRWALVWLTLLVAIAGAAVLCAAAGARRAGTSLDRLASESHSADLLVDVGALDSEIVDRIERLDLVSVHGRVTVVYALVDGVEDDLAIMVPLDASLGTQIESDRVVRGRRPDPQSVTEVAVNEIASEIVGVDVGDHVSIATMTPAQVSNEEYFPPLGPRLEMQVVGVTRGIDDLSPQGGGGFIGSEALLEALHGKAEEYTTLLAVTLAAGTTVGEFEAAIAEIVPPEQSYGTLSYNQRSAAARGTISSIASGLAVFALVVAVAALVAIGQAVGRHIAGAQQDDVVLGKLGLTRAARRVALTCLVLPSAIAGAALAVLGAWLASPLMPVGLARRAEPNLGFSFDWLVLAVGALAVALVVVASASAAASWLTRTRPAAQTQPTPSVVASAVARAGLGATAVIGVRLALDRRPPALPVRSAIVGVAAAILGVVAALTFSASLDRLTDTPARWGYQWDLMLNFDSRTIDTAIDDVVRDGRLAAVARWDAGFSYVEGDGVRAYGLTPLLSDVGFSLRTGRQPFSTDEVVLGPETAARLEVGIGERVDVAAAPGAAEQTSVLVVGTALFPDDQEGSFRDAVGYFGPAFAEHAIAPDLFEVNQLVVNVKPGLNIDVVRDQLNDEYPGSAASGENLPVAPGGVANLTEIRPFPNWLAAFVAVLGLASLGHVLYSTVWRRRSELAIHRSLGLTSRQTVRCIIYQAMTITLVGLAIGIPLGIVVGNAAWFAVADPIGVATDTTRSLVMLSAFSLSALVVAAAIAIGPGWSATRLRPGVALRTE